MVTVTSTAARAGLAGEAVAVLAELADARPSPPDVDRPDLAERLDRAADTAARRRRHGRRGRRVQAGQEHPGQRVAAHRHLPGRRRHRHRRADHPAVRPPARRVPADPRPDGTLDAACRSPFDAAAPARHRGRRRPTRPAPRSVEVRLDRRLLGAGLSFIDTPGVGGLDSAQGNITLATLPLAGAALFVTDAAQELTAPEVDFLRRIAGTLPPGLLRGHQDRPVRRVAPDRRDQPGSPGPGRPGRADRRGLVVPADARPGPRQHRAERRVRLPAPGRPAAPGRARRGRRQPASPRPAPSWRSWSAQLRERVEAEQRRRGQRPRPPPRSRSGTPRRPGAAPGSPAAPGRPCSATASRTSPPTSTTTCANGCG